MRNELEEIKRILLAERCEESKWKHRLFIVGIGLTMVATAGAIWYFFFKDKNNDDDWDDDDWDDLDDDDDDLDDDDFELDVEDIVEGTNEDDIVN